MKEGEGRKKRRKKGKRGAGGSPYLRRNYITHKPRPRGRKCCSAKEG